MGGTRLIDRVRGAQGRLRGGSGGSGGGGGRPSGSIDKKQFEALKAELHSEVIESMDFEQVGETDKSELHESMRKQLSERVEARNLPLNRMERERLVEEVLDNILGLGPLEPLIRDPDVSDIMINGPKTIFVERKGKMVKTNVTFNDNDHLLQIIDRIISAVGRRVDESNPMVDARMADGSRFNAIIPPLAIDGAAVSIRRFGTVPIGPEDLISFGSCPRPMMETLKGAVSTGLNTIISGGTGSGKTTLLNCLSSFIPAQDRVITIEDAAELQLQAPHIVRLETRPANLEGKGEVTARDLVKNCLRMRPDRIILGEIRGAEAVDVLTAMNTGHDGSLATVHSNSPRDCLSRFETMVAIGMPNMGANAIRETIARAIDLVVQQTRLNDGSRRVISITEITGMEGSVITTQEIFTFDQEGVSDTGKILGKYRATGVRPRFTTRLASNGIRLSPELFRWSMEV